MDTDRILQGQITSICAVHMASGLRRMLRALLLMLPAMATAQQMPLRYYGQQDGLANVAVTAMARDHAGYLWIGTDNGLFRYNGSSFKRYGLAEGLSEPA